MIIGCKKRPTRDIAWTCEAVSFATDSEIHCTTGAASWMGGKAEPEVTGPMWNRSKPKTKPSVSLGIHGARLILSASAVAESVLFALSERELEGSSFRTGGLGLIQVLDPCTKCECCLLSGFRAAERGKISFLVARGRRCGLRQIHECNLALPKCLLQLAV